MIAGCKTVILATRIVMIKLFALLGTFFASLGIILGAFGAHALKQHLSESALNAFEVGVKYQMYHALGLLATAWLLVQFSHPCISLGGILMAIGTVIFSGSLYMLSLSGIKIFGIITPLGGLFLVVAWALIFVGIWLK